MTNRLIPADQVAREIVESINKTTRDLSEDDKRQFIHDFVDWLYRVNRFPADATAGNREGG